MRPSSLMQLERLLNHAMSKMESLGWHKLNCRVRDLKVDVSREEVKNFPRNKKQLIFTDLLPRQRSNIY